MKSFQLLLVTIALALIGYGTYLVVSTGGFEFGIPSYQATTYTLDESVDFIELNLDSRDITVIKGNQDFVSIEYWYLSQEMVITAAGDYLQVDEPDMTWFDQLRYSWASSETHQMIVTIPDDTIVDLKIITLNGSIDISSEMTYTNIVADTLNGSITLSDATAPTIELSTLNGDIHVSDVTCSDILLIDSTNGDYTDQRGVYNEMELNLVNNDIILIDLSVNKLTGALTNGEVYLHVLSFNEIDISNINGGMILDYDGYLPNSEYNRITLMGSKVFVNSTISNSNFSVLIGTGDKTIFLETLNGDVVLQYTPS